MIHIRSEQAVDGQSIRQVHTAAFPTDAEARLVDALRAASDLHVSLVACIDDAVVGHIAFSPVTAPAAGGLGLAPLAVLPRYQRRGVGGQLIRAGLAACERTGCAFVVVMGEPAYYGRFGFRPASRWALVDEYGGGDAFQAIELRPGALAGCAGLVQYAPAFAALDTP
jgi:putative acetyltransferase